MTHAPFGDEEAALLDYLADLGDTFTRTPLDLRTRLAGGPAHRVRRIGGGDTRQSDEPRVSVTTYALRTSGDPRAGKAAAEAVRARMLSLSGVVAPGIRLDSADTVSGPVELDYPDSAVYVAEAIYRVRARRA